MATLTPLTVGNTAAPTGQWASATNGDLGDNSDSTFGTVTNNATGTYDQGWELGNVDADFASMDTLSAVLRYRWTATPNGLTTWDSLQVRVMDGATVLAAANSGGTFQTVASSITTTTITNSASTAFGYVNTGASKAQWDAAIVEIRISQTKSKGGDTTPRAVYEADFTGTYTVASPSTNAPAELATATAAAYGPTLTLASNAPAGLATATATAYNPTISIPPTGYAGVVLGDSPSAYWRLGEASGTNAADEVGTNDGTYNNTPTLGVTGALTGDSDTAITLTKASFENVTVPDDAALDLGDGPFSIELWAKRTGGGGGAWQLLITKGTNAYAVGFSSGDLFSLTKSGVSVIVSENDGSTTDTNWHHWVATKNGSSVFLYKDGSDVTGTVTDATLSDTGSQLEIGSEASSLYFDGSVDEVALYKSVLSSAQVSAHYDAATGTATNAPAGLATATATAYNTAMRYAPAGLASTTAAAGAPTPSVAPAAALATAAASGLAPAVSAQPSAALATAAASGLAPAAAIEVPAGLATAAATAYNPTVDTAAATNAPAELAAATAAAADPAVSIEVPAEAAAATATAYGTAMQYAPAGLAAASASAYNPTIDTTAGTSAPAELATATATALAPTAAIEVPAGLAAAAATAYNPTVSTVAATNAPAELAAATAVAPAPVVALDVNAAAAAAIATAYNPTVSTDTSTSAPAGLATAAAAALGPAVWVEVSAGLATAAATAYNPTVSAVVSTDAPAGLATATAAALDPGISVWLSALLATAAATAYNPTVSFADVIYEGGPPPSGTARILEQASGSATHPAPSGTATHTVPNGS